MTMSKAQTDRPEVTMSSDGISVLSTDDPLHGANGGTGDGAVPMDITEAGLVITGTGLIGVVALMEIRETPTTRSEGMRWRIRSLALWR